MIGMMTAVGLFGLSAADYRTARADITAQQTRYIAEAGIFRALAKIEEEPMWQDGFQSVSFGEGVYDVTVITIPQVNQTVESRQPTSDKNKQGTQVSRIVRIRSEGRIPPRARKSIEILYDTRQKKIVDWSE